MTIAQLKIRFVEEMKLIFDKNEYQPRQVRDVWRIYFMGCVAGMSNPTSLLLEADNLNMHDLNWWPDKSFYWWLS